MLSSEPKAEADNIYQDLDFQERSVHTYIRPYARAYSWNLENMFIFSWKHFFGIIWGWLINFSHYIVVFVLVFPLTFLLFNAGDHTPRLPEFGVSYPWIAKPNLVIVLLHRKEPNWHSVLGNHTLLCAQTTG